MYSTTWTMGTSIFHNHLTVEQEPAPRRYSIEPPTEASYIKYEHQPTKITREFGNTPPQTYTKQ